MKTHTYSTGALRPVSLALLTSLVLATGTTDGIAQAPSSPAHDSIRSHPRHLDSTSAACHRALWHDSTNIEAWEGLIRIAQRETRYEEELALARRATALLPLSARSHVLLGDAYLDNGYVPEAVEILRRAIELDTTSVRALTLLAEAWDLAEMSDSTLFYIDSALRLNPRNVQAHYQRADHLYRVGRRLEAVESYEAWATLQPFLPEPWVKLGEALTTVGHYEEAIEALRYALELSPESAEAAYHHAVALHGLGKSREAREAFVSFFFTHPTHPRAPEAEQMARALGWSPTGD